MAQTPEKTPTVDVETQAAGKYLGTVMPAPPTEPLGRRISTFSCTVAELDATCVAAYGCSLDPIGRNFSLAGPFEVPPHHAELMPDRAVRAFEVWRRDNDVDDNDADHIVHVVLARLHADGRIPAGLYLVAAEEGS